MSEAAEAAAATQQAQDEQVQEEQKQEETKGSVHEGEEGEEEEEEEEAEENFINNHDLIGVQGIIAAQKDEIEKKKVSAPSLSLFVTEVFAIA